MSAHGHPPRVTARQPWEGGARAGSCAQVPGGSGSLAAAARQLGMFEKDIFDSAPARSAWRSLVVVWLGAGNARLSRPETPPRTPLNVTKSAHAPAFAGVDRERILLNDSAPTALERADGNWGPGSPAAGGDGRRRRSDARSPPWRPNSTGTSRHPSGSRAQGRTTNLVSGRHLGGSSWSGRPCRSGTPVPSSAADVRGQSVLIAGQDARGDSRPPRGAEASHGRWLLAWRLDTLAAHFARLLTAVATLGWPSRASSRPSRPLACHRTRA